MRIKIGLVALAIIASGSFAYLMILKATQVARGQAKSTHIVLIGASIGQGWHIAEWPTRVNVSGFTAESIPAWQFDKAKALDEVLMRPHRRFHPTRTYLKSLVQPAPRKARIVILKECSSYFPGDLQKYEGSIREWVVQIREKNITVVLTTVIPVTETRARQNPGKQESLLQYNDWIRGYAQQEGLILLDLEAALRTAERGRFLREEYASHDGTHLNADAYAVLDKLLRETLVDWKSPSAIAAAP